MLFLLLAPLLASASDPSSTCYRLAEDANADISVVVNDVPVLGPTHQLAEVFSAIAKADPTETTVQYDEAGKNAITGAMKCFLEHDTATLGMMRLHQIAPELAIRGGGLIQVQRSAGPLVMNEVKIGGNSRSGDPIFIFSGQTSPDSCLSVALPATLALATGDWYFQASSSEPTAGQSCTGVHCTRCDFKADGYGCEACSTKQLPDPKSAGSCNHTVTSGGNGLGGFVPAAHFLTALRF